MAQDGAPVSYRDRLLKRLPLRDDVALTLTTDGLYAPVKRRAAMCFFDVPAAALVAGGAVYYPPPGGAIVRHAIAAVDVGSSPWRWGLGTVATIASSGAVGGQSVVPVWPDAPLAGQWEAFQFFGIGDLFRAGVNDTPAYNINIPVMPGNLFILALTGANLAAEGGIYVEEYVDGSEQL